MTDVQRKALDYLIGVDLPIIFTRHFEAPATVLAPGAGGTTSFIRFAIAVAKEAGIAGVDAAVVCEIGRRHGLPEGEPS